jgi:predicted AAA+ superfamily ATPase
MLPRRIGPRLDQMLTHSPAVVLLGPRQVGKTTLALEISATRPSVYLDLEDEDERVKLSNPTRYFADHERDLVILDEVHRVPELFQRLRGVIDRGRRQGKENGRFLLLGSAAMDLLRSPAKAWRAHFLFGAWPIRCFGGGAERYRNAVGARRVSA